jgi:hypothetical protein
MSSCECQPLVRDLCANAIQRAMDVDNPVNFDMNMDMNGDFAPFGEDAFMPLSPGLGTAQGLIEPRPVSLIS